STVIKDIEATRDQALQGIVIPGGFVTTTGYILMGLSAERHQSDAATDALVRLLKLTQRPDGHWTSTYRPPFEAREFTATAVSLRAMQLSERRRIPPRSAISVDGATRRRLVVRQDTLTPDADLLRERLSARREPVYFGGRDELGDAGAGARLLA